MKIHTSLPIADGICFDDTLGLSDGQVKMLITRRVVFATEFLNRDTGRTYYGAVIAPTRKAARAITAKRGLGEKVSGHMVASVSHG